MACSEIKTKQNIVLTKEYLQKFVTAKKVPDWVSFCEYLMDRGYFVILYLPENMTSVYLTVVKHNKKQMVRFSYHCPSIKRFLKAEVNYYVGPRWLQMLSVQEVLDVFRIYFR